MMTVYHGGYELVSVPETRTGRIYKRFRTWFLLYRYQRAGTALGKKVQQKICFYL